MTLTLSHSASGGGYGSVTFGSVAVTVRDNDLVVPTALTVAEGSTGTYSVVLDTQPSAAVTVTVGGASGDVSVDKSALTFTTTDWGTAQTVTVAAAEDDDAATDDAVTLTHAASGGGFGTVAFGSVAVSVTEDDTAGATVTPGALTVTEGSSGTYTVVLGSEPTADVTVSVSGASGDVSVDKSSLTFTDSNWSAAQTVTVSAGEDADRAADAAVTLAHSASGGGYGSVTLGSVAVTVRDNDLVVPTALTVAEGSTGTYSVVLDTQPSAAVTVTVGGTSGDVSVDKSSLTFTTTDWGTAQTVTVSAAEDDDAATDDAVTLTHSASGGGFGTVAFGSVAVSVTENDTAGATVTPGALTVIEGSSGTYTVVLGTRAHGGRDGERQRDRRRRERGQELADLHGLGLEHGPDRDRLGRGGRRPGRGTRR